jgi:hypothetical protein
MAETLPIWEEFSGGNETVVLANLDQIDELGDAAQQSTAVRTLISRVHRFTCRVVSGSCGASP